MIFTPLKANPIKICILGGTGNISTSIVDLLLKNGHEVTCYNRGNAPSLPAGVRLIRGDRKNRTEFEETMAKERFDAAIDMISFTRDDAASSLRAFRDVKHFVHCSTVCTYGVDYDWLPVTEDHPLRPISDYGRNKAAADALLLEAYHRDGFPVTILRPSTTYGPKMGLFRQINTEFAWIDRIRKGKPLLVCGDGNALHQHLFVSDAAPAFVHVLGRKTCLGQIYNVVNRGYITWVAHHRLAMQVLGREVELVGVPMADLSALKVPAFGICESIFGHSLVYSPEKLFRDVTEFRPVVSLAEGMRRVIEALDRDGRIPNSDASDWEDRIITAQRKVRADGRH
jgi:nucleoside-diphosphate-sugar epimerase